MKIQYQDIAELLGISLQSAKVYLDLLIHHELSLADLQKLTGLNKTLVLREVRRLIKANLVNELKVGKNRNIYQGVSFLQLEEKLERDKLILQNLKKVIVPALQQSQRLGIMKYEGIEGIRKVYLEILEEAQRTGEDILAIESGIDIEVLGNTFIANYIKRRLSYNVKALIITPNTATDRQFLEDNESRLTAIKLLPNFKIDSNINVVGDLVMTFSLNPLQGTLRRDKAEARTYKAIFNKLWGI